MNSKESVENKSIASSIDKNDWAIVGKAGDKLERRDSSGNDTAGCESHHDIDDDSKGETSNEILQSFDDGLLSFSLGQAEEPLTLTNSIERDPAEMQTLGTRMTGFKAARQARHDD